MGLASFVHSGTNKFDFRRSGAGSQRLGIAHFGNGRHIRWLVEANDERGASDDFPQADIPSAIGIFDRQ